MNPDGTAEGGFERRAADWLSPEDALARVLGAAVPMPTEAVPLPDALDRALAEDVRARALLPPWDNSAMDGFAVRAADIAGASDAHPVRLPVVGGARAGAETAEPLAPGSALRIMTGAPVPPGADSVVRVEHTDGESTPGAVVVRSDHDALANIRPAGQDMRPADVIATAGRSVDPGVVAVLAAAGLEEVVVRRRPRVSILTTGDELRRADRFSDVAEGRGIPDTNGPMLAAAVLGAGGVPSLGGVVPDDRERLRAAVRASCAADALVTVGGASMGEADLVKRVLDEMGFELDFWRVTMRPGSPFGFGRLPRPDGGPPIPVFSLPGNPASALVTFELFVRPWVRAVLGHERVVRRRSVCVAGEALRGSTGLTFYMRVRVADEGGRQLVRPTGPQGSGLVRGLALADGLAVIPPEPGTVAEGESVDVLWLSGFREAPSTP